MISLGNQKTWYHIQLIHMQGQTLHTCQARKIDVEVDSVRSIEPFQHTANRTYRTFLINDGLRYRFSQQIIYIYIYMTSSLLEKTQTNLTM